MSKIIHGLLGSSIIVALTLGIAVPGQAATATWWSGNSNSWTTHSESLSSANTYSRTGQYLELTGASGLFEGYVWTRLSLGSISTDGWSLTQSINSTRRLGASGRGSFTWHSGGAVTQDTVYSQARATGASLVGLRSGLNANLEGLSPTDIEALTNAAAEHQVPVSAFRIVGKTDNTHVLRSEYGGRAFLAAITSDSVAFVTSESQTALETRAINLHITNPEVQVEQQFVLSTQESASQMRDVQGLVEVGEKVFVDTALQTRLEATENALPQSSTERSPSSYAVPLSARS